MGFGYGNKVPATTIVSSTNALRMRFDTSNDESTSGAGFNLTATGEFLITIFYCTVLYFAHYALLSRSSLLQSDVFLKLCALDCLIRSK